MGLRRGLLLSFLRPPDDFQVNDVSTALLCYKIADTLSTLGEYPLEAIIFDFHF
jgi:hypothetical protein